MSTVDAISSGISSNEANVISPRIVSPAATGLTGTTRNPLRWRYFIAKYDGRRELGEAPTIAITLVPASTLLMNASS
jgi:hypothetical protein